MESSKVNLKGGAGSADYVISKFGDMGGQRSLSGSNVIAPKVGGSPLTPATCGGRKSRKQQRKKKVKKGGNQQQQQEKQQQQQENQEQQEEKQQQQEENQQQQQGGKKKKQQEKQQQQQEKQQQQQEKQQQQQEQQEQQEQPEKEVGGSLVVDLALPAVFIGATHLYRKGKTSKMVPSQFRARLYSRRNSRRRR